MPPSRGGAKPHDALMYELGKLTASLETIEKAVRENRSIADERHAENLGKLETLGLRMLKAEVTMSSVETELKTMAPLVTSLTMSRMKLAGAFGLAVALVTLLGWAISTGAIKIIDVAATRMGVK